MSEFNEFDQQGSVPQRDTGSIISHAFGIFKGVFLYALAAMIINIVVETLLETIFGYNLWNSFRVLRDMDGDYSRFKPEISWHYSFSGLFGILLSPLYVGLIYIANKFNNKIPAEFPDLFIGYRQNLGNILLYSLVTYIILSLSALLCLIPVFFVFPLFFIGYPILLFENATALDALSKTYNIAKENYGVFLGAGILSLLITASGILLCVVGIIFTYPFIYVAMYSAYCAYLGKPRQINYNK